MFCHNVFVEATAFIVEVVVFFVVAVAVYVCLDKATCILLDA